MWLRLLPLLCLVLMSSTALTQQNAIAVPFDNTTVAGSPIEVTGNLSVREVIAGNEVESWWEGSVVGKNISNKPILLLIGDFTEIGPHSDTGTRVIIDSFFYQRLIQPEATFPLVRGGMRHYGECCINPLDESNDPKFDFRVLFVQFLDGSTFGDPTLGKDVLADRTSTLHGLRELARTYLDDGELKFQTQLEQAQGVEFYGIRRTKEQKGVGAAVTEVREMLAIGEQHRATLGQQATK